MTTEEGFPQNLRRRQLEEACERVRRQIEIQAASAPLRDVPNEARRDALISELQELLDELEECLEESGPDA